MTTYILDYGSFYRVGAKTEPTHPFILHCYDTRSIGRARKHAEWVHKECRTDKITCFDMVEKQPFPKNLTEFYDQIRKEQNALRS